MIKCKKAPDKPKNYTNRTLLPILIKIRGRGKNTFTIGRRVNTKNSHVILRVRANRINSATPLVTMLSLHMHQLPSKKHGKLEHI